MKDLVGRDVTPVEKRLLKAYETLKALLAEDLPPCAAANVREAAAAMWQVVNDLALRYERLDDLRL